jgi:hypothetical protein
MTFSDGNLPLSSQTSAISGVLAGSLQGKEESGVGVVRSLRRGDVERGQMASEEVAREASGALHPRDDLDATWVGLDAIGQGCGVLGMVLWTLSISANQSVGVPLLRSCVGSVNVCGHLNVEPFLSPTLNWLGHLKLKILRLWSHRDNGPTKLSNFG